MTANQIILKKRGTFILENGKKILSGNTELSQEEINLMEQGIFKGFVIQKPFKMGYLGVKYTIEMLKGEEVPRQVDAGSELVTPENMYTGENEKLLFPFK